MRLIPIFPFSIVCYAAGAARVPLWRYLWTTAVGYLPITAISVYFGTRLEGLSLTDPLVIGTAVGLLALLLGGHWVMRRQAAAHRALRPRQRTRLTRKRKTAGAAVDVAGARRGRGPGPCACPAPKRREIRRPQKRGRPRSTLQTKLTPASLDAKRKTAANAAAVGANRASAGAWRYCVRGAWVSIAKPAAPLAPARPARSTPLTAMPWLPSASAAGTTKGEAQGCAGPPSTSQLKATGRLALNSIVGRRLRLERRRRLRDRDLRRQRQGGDGAVGIDQPGADRRRAEGADRPRGRRSAARTWAAEAPGLACRTSAATAAACGAAAEVPKKRQTPAWRTPKKVLAPPSVAARSGLAMTCSADRRPPAPGRSPGRSSA